MEALSDLSHYLMDVSFSRAPRANDTTNNTLTTSAIPTRLQPTCHLAPQSRPRLQALTTAHSRSKPKSP